MKKKPIIIVGIVFALIIIALIVYLVLSLTTDIFKPTSEIFQRYLKENVENIEKIIDLSKEQDYINTLSQGNYRDNTKVSFKYANSQGNVENFSLTSEGITNNSDKNSNRTINLKYGEDYNIMDIEYLQENQIYGLLFSNVVKQFVSADIDNTEEFTNIIGINIQELQKYNIPEIYNLITKEKENLKKVCINYFAKLNNRLFSKQKSVQIILNNGESQTAKAYSLNLSEEQTKELYLEFLKELGKQEEINKINTNKTQFTETQIVIYVVNNKAIRATVEVGNKQIRIDFYENEANIKYSNITGEEINTVNLDIKRGEQDTLIYYEDLYNNKINIKYNISEDLNSKNANIQLNLQNDYIKGLELALNQNIETSNSTIEGIQKKFENEPNVNITKLNSNDRNSALNSLIQRIDTLITNKNNQVNSEILNIWLQINKELENEYQGIKEKQRNEFNNQFLSYRGDNVEKQIIYNLLDLSGRNMEKYEEIGESNFRIYISQGTKNVNLAEEIKSKIEKSDKQFSINFGFDSEGKINTVEIRGYKKQ